MQAEIIRSNKRGEAVGGMLPEWLLVRFQVCVGRCQKSVGVFSSRSLLNQCSPGLVKLFLPAVAISSVQPAPSGGGENRDAAPAARLDQSLKIKACKLIHDHASEMR